MSSTTFFGEVNELNSRAVYWSDNESDDDCVGQHTTDDHKITLKLNDELNTNWQTIYVSLAKSDKTVAKGLTPIGAVTVDGVTGIVANMYAIGDKALWIQLYTNHPNLKNHLLVKTISTVMRQTLDKCQSTTNRPSVCVVSEELTKDMASDDAITYLTTDDSNLSVIPIGIKRIPLMAPKMLNNLVESGVFEYCIVFGVHCIALLFPEIQSKHFDRHFLPKQITDSVHQSNQLIESNIYL